MFCDWCVTVKEEPCAARIVHAGGEAREARICGSCMTKINGTRSKVKTELPPHLESVAKNLRERYANKLARARHVVMSTNDQIVKINGKISSMNEDLEVAFDDLLEVVGEMRVLRNDVLSWFGDRPVESYDAGVPELLESLESARLEIPDVPQIDELDTFAFDEESLDCGVPDAFKKS